MGSKKENPDYLTLISSENADDLNEIISIIPSEEEDEFNKTPIPDKLPILPLRNTVLFPSTVIPITISREKSIQLVDEAYATNKKVGVVAQKSHEIDHPGLDDIYQVGTVAHIIKKFRLPDDNTMVIIQGVKKFRIKEIVETEPYYKARVETITPPKPEITQKLQAMIDSIKELSGQIIKLSPNIPKEAAIALQNI
jgi:ATP-dependent Lon protease